MKLLLLSTSSSRNAGGLYNSVRNLGQALMKLDDVEPTVIAFNDTFSDVDVAAYAPLPIVEYNVIGPKGVAFSTQLMSEMNKLKPELVHAQGIYLYSSRVNYKYCKKHNIPYLISPRGMLDPWILNTNPLKKKIGFALYESAHLNNAACLHALGMPEYTAIRNFGSKNPIAIVPNGVFLPAAKNIDAKDIPKWKSKDDRKILLFLSRLHKKKGIEHLMQAWLKAGELKAGWKIVIAGESNNAEYLQSLLDLRQQLKLENDVEFIGAQFHADKDICFRLADAFILPSFSEGMPMAVLEAWSYGLPVIITEECNIPEGFEEKAAIKIEPNADSVAEGLDKLFGMTAAEAEEMGNNGYQLVKKKFAWSSIAEQMNDIYKWVLGKGPLPGTVKLD